MMKGSVAWTPGELLQLVRNGVASSRSAMSRHTGLSPSTVATRIQGLLDSGHLTEDDKQSDRGRRPRELVLNARWGIVAAVDIGARHTRIALVDTAGTLLTVTEHQQSGELGGEAHLAWLADEISRSAAATRRPLRGVGISIAGPVDLATRQVSHPMYLPGWDAVAPAEALAAVLGVPVVVDNDATLMALGEHRVHYPDVRSLVYLKLGSAIGAGLIINGVLHSGGRGGAGEIGHMPTEAGDYARPCRCGRMSCLEACFGGSAVAERLAVVTGSADVPDIRDVAASGDPAVLGVLRDAGARIGDAAGVICNLVNPELVVIGGSLSQSEALTHALRSALYERTLPLIAEGLVVAVSRNGPDASVMGAAWRALDMLLAPESVNESLTPMD